MSWPAIFENFVEESPVTVMMRGTLERIISPEKLNELFDKTAQQQYTRELLFSDVVEVMMPVVAGMRPSVHASLPQQSLSPLRRIGESETGEVWEPTVLLEQEGQQLQVRRVVVRLHQPTRDGETEIAILTNLEETVADGFKVAELYRKRWTVETFFQVLTTSLNCEIKTLGYPRAALFSFSMALLAYNALSTLRAALRSVHGTGKIEAGLSNYYLAEEITMTYRGMMIAIPPQHWEIFHSMSQEPFCSILQELAKKVKLSAFLSRPRGPKKKKKKPTYDPQHPHVSTAQLLASKKKTS